MNKFSISRWFIIGVTTLAGCQNYDRSAHFWLFNHSNHTVYYWLSCDSAFRDLSFSVDYQLKAGDSVQPYLLYGPEGEGPNSNKWINAINRADDSALHIFYYYVDYEHHSKSDDSVYHLIIRRSDLRVDSLAAIRWRVVYR